ncbi:MULTISPECIES: S9 family peptidase [Corynebacterium]|uniref:S9 family peptidase n=1 Tax=Corynebacterium phoceense TaxID=1686286 RepID=A0A540R9Q0_9CORY|nr:MULTISPECIES: S9 family peptidase [Corynebacterium]MBF9010853.1 S9 family peptidase [Corynebacterium phoceense]OFN44665.1 protease 2 [Corynebacterium sp. HMSC072G08]TQE44468.1 S9 family peptidase [Corynebacterium phoceense]
MTVDPSLAAPRAAQHPVTRSFHGRDFVDDYEWMRDKESPETIAYLEAENAYTEARTEHLQQLSENIFAEVKSRVKETDMSVPVLRDGYWYYGRTEEGKSYGLSCRLKAAEGAEAWSPIELPEEGAPEGEEVLLDSNVLAEGHEFFQVGAVARNRETDVLAFGVDTVGDERFEVSFKDLKTGELLADRLDGVYYYLTWAGPNYIFYTTVDEAWRSDKVWRHKMGTPQSEDVLVFHEEDARFGVGVGTTKSREFLFVQVQSKTTTEAWVVGLDNPEGELRRLWERRQDVDYDVDHAVVGGKDYWLVTHNATGANYELGYCPVAYGADLPEFDQLTVLMPHEETVRIEGPAVYRDQIVVGYRRGGIGRAAIMDVREGWGEFKELEFDEELYEVSVGGAPDWEADVLRVGYTSYTQPSQLFNYRVTSGEYKLLKEQEVPGGYDASQYVAHREWVTAPDGAQIPVSIVRRADLDMSKPNPTLLYGYGSYEVSMDPYFSVFRLSLMDRGVIFAVAHVRGGGEMGRAWYDNGKLLHKKNTFTDFIAVADDLIARGVTAPEVLAAEGGSAGGLLMGAVANMAPERFRAIQASVPFVDPLTSILMPELPLTVVEWEEWGDPFHDPTVYDYMASYAPYENVTAQNYPDILALTSLNDTRVLYVEPAKWIAKLRATATGGEFLLKTEMVAGHGGVSGRYAQWRQAAFEYAWTINKITGLTA